MATRDEVRSVLRCEPAPAGGRRPLFLPAVYEHKAFFLDDTPSRVSRDADLLSGAVLAEYAALQPDALTIGLDVYNLEAEAAGCRVTFYEGDDTSIPGIRPGDHVVDASTDFASRPVPNPLRDGRMPVNIEATRRVVAELGGDVWIRGALSGPFSLAISLMGAEEFFLCCWDDPDASKRLLEYCTAIIKEFGAAYIDAGAEVILFDSQASPDLLSPKMYREYVLPFTRSIVEHFRQLGVSPTCRSSSAATPRASSTSCLRPAPTICSATSPPTGRRGRRAAARPAARCGATCRRSSWRRPPRTRCSRPPGRWWRKGRTCPASSSVPRWSPTARRPRTCWQSAGPAPRTTAAESFIA